MLRLAVWWFCWWFLVINTLLAAYRLESIFHRGLFAIIAIWLLWLITRCCGSALVAFCREDLRGARRWQHRLGSKTIPTLFEARVHFAVTFWLWWGVVVCGGIVALHLTIISHRIAMSVGCVLALALATVIRGHAAVDLYRASATASARRRIGAGD